MCPQTAGLSTDIPVGRVFHAVAYMAVLKVEECAKALYKLPLGLAIDIEVGFPSSVAVVLETREHFLLWLLHPVYQTEVVTVVFVPASAQSGLETFVVVVVD